MYRMYREWLVYIPGDSSRDLLIPQLEVTNNHHLKGHVFTHSPSQKGDGLNRRIAFFPAKMKGSERRKEAPKNPPHTWNPEKKSSSKAPWGENGFNPPFVFREKSLRVKRLQDFLGEFSARLFGEMIQFDKRAYFSFMGGKKPSTR